MGVVLFNSRYLNWLTFFTKPFRVVFALFYRLLRKADYMEREDQMRRQCDLSPSVVIGSDAVISGNVSIGEGTYVNSGKIISGKSSKIVIGSWCAIGYNVNILTRTHDSNMPTGLTSKFLERDICIGDYCWIGSNAFIREGVSIGNNTIVGANSVVTKDFPPYSVIGGVPARLIRQNGPDATFSDDETKIMS